MYTYYKQRSQSVNVCESDNHTYQKQFQKTHQSALRLGFKKLMLRKKYNRLQSKLHTVCI